MAGHQTRMGFVKGHKKRINEMEKEQGKLMKKFLQIKDVNTIIATFTSTEKMYDFKM